MQATWKFIADSMEQIQTWEDEDAKAHAYQSLLDLLEEKEAASRQLLLFPEAEDVRPSR